MMQGIPHAFIVDHNLKVRWHGHPMDPSFESTIQKAVDGASPVEVQVLLSLTSLGLLFCNADVKSQSRIDVKGKSREELMAMPVKDLKQVLADHGISPVRRSLVEKGDLVTVILEECT